MLEMIVMAVYFSIGPIIGLTGSLLGWSVQRQIMEDLGVDSLPWNQKQRDLLIAERCDYIWRWNKIDTFNLVVFFIGAIGLTVSVILEGIQMSGPKQILFWNEFPLVFCVLLQSIILVIISLMMIIVRLLYLMRLYRLSQIRKEEKEKMKETPVNQNPKSASKLFIILTSVLALVYSLSSVLVIKEFGLPVFWVISGIFVILMVVLSIREVKKQMKNKEKY